MQEKPYRIVCEDGNPINTRVFYKDISGKEFELKNIFSVSWSASVEGQTTIKIEAIGAKLGGGNGCNL